MATDSTSPNTIWPRLSISETGYVCSAWPRLAGPVLVVQFVAGFCDRGDFFSARRCCLRFKIASLFLTYHSCFSCLAKSGSLFGVKKTGSCPGSSSISIVLSANHSPRSRDGVGGGICTLGGPPLIFLLSIKLITWCLFHQSPDHHLIRLLQSQLLGYHVIWSIKASFLHGKSQIVSAVHPPWRIVFLMWTTHCITSVMKKTERTPFWTERLTGGSSWETAPPEVPSLNLPCNLLGDDAAGIMSWSGRSSMLSCVIWGILWLGIIWGWLWPKLYTMPSRLKYNDSSGHQINLSVSLSPHTGSPMPIKQLISPWASSCNGRLDWMRCRPNWRAS